MNYLDLAAAVFLLAVYCLLCVLFTPLYLVYKAIRGKSLRW